MPSTLNAAAVIDELVRNGVLDTEALHHAVGGADPRQAALPAVEKVLVDQQLVDDNEILTAKQRVSGLHGVHAQSAHATTELPYELASRAGAVAINAPTPTVAVVEDRDDVLSALHTHYGSAPEVWVTTRAQFNEFLAAYRTQGEQRRKHPDSVSELLDEAMRRHATDLHLQAGWSPYIRSGGRLQELTSHAAIDDQWLRDQIGRMLPAVKVEAFREHFDADAAYEHQGRRLRLNAGVGEDGATLAVRILPAHIPTMADLGVPGPLQQVIHEDRGLVLVTGPTGSGKSTTLAALLSEIARRHPRRIVTLEDPIEYRLPRGQALVTQRELGSSFSSFSAGLRQALRMDPDVVLVGEMRDAETIATALEMAETGHLVLATSHAHDAVTTLERLIGTFPAGEQDSIRSKVKHVLRVIASQTLLPRREAGGLVAAYEVLVATTGVRNNLDDIHKLAAVRNEMTTGRSYGMQTMERALADLVRHRTVERAEALSRAERPSEFETYLEEQ